MRNSFYKGVGRRMEDVRVFARRLERVRLRVPDLKLIARTEALVAGLGSDEAVIRARAYADAGVDAIFVQTITSTVREFEMVLDRLKGTIPIVVAPTKMPIGSRLAIAPLDPGHSPELFAWRMMSVVHPVLARAEDRRSWQPRGACLP
jgi:2-methylisocitrate lyase-like PEP mutase family enzyme